MYSVWEKSINRYYSTQYIFIENKFFSSSHPLLLFCARLFCVARRDDSAADRDKPARDHVQHSDTAGNRRLAAFHLSQGAATAAATVDHQPRGSHALAVPIAPSGHRLQSFLRRLHHRRRFALRYWHPPMRFDRWALCFYNFCFTKELFLDFLKNV